MTRVTAGQAVVATLEQTGIRHAFTVPGESFLEILDALRDSSIRLVAVRHEAGAGFMAEAYAQLTGRPALCLVTRAVGAANISIALHTAMQNSTPLVVLAGQVPRPFRGREAFQEADLVASFGALCKAAAELDEPTTMAAGVGRLVEVAQTGRPGPVLIALPEDALEEAIEDARATSDPAAGRPPAGGLAATDVPAPLDSLVRDLLGRLSNARRPVIVAGGGVLRSGAVAELQAFAEATGLGVIAAWRRPDVFPNDSPRYLGATGLAAARTVRARLREADVILALGTRLSEVASFEYTVPGPATELLHVDIAPGFGGARPAPALAVRADARAFLRAALAVLAGTGESTRSGQSIRSARGRDPHRSSVADLAAQRAVDLARDRAAYVAAVELPNVGPRGPDEPVHPATVVAALRRHLAPGAIITTDAGNFAGWVARYLPLPPGARFLGPTSGAMGYGLPAAVGAAIASRDQGAPARPVVALAGDGGFAMLMAELETAVREGLRLTVLVFDNAMYGTIRMHQERAHPGRVAATDLGRIDCAAFAEACGARGLRVAHDTEVEAAIAAALADPGVTLVHLLTDPRVISVDTTLPG